jgi:nucleoid-associated protein YgaU
VSDRGLPVADGAHACPFVAFEDERDERSSVPDHRHRCYAEDPPAPRAVAHQEAYCLSSAFPVCPTFQDWARRESARARGEAPPRPAAAAAAEAEIAAAAASAAAAAHADDAAAPPYGPDVPASIEPPNHYDNGEARRNPPREWSAPPPWLASAEAADAARERSDPPSFLASRSQPGQGLAGSPADRLAGGPPPASRPAAGYGPPTTGTAAAGAAMPSDARSEDHTEPDLPQPAPPPRRPRAYDQHLGGPAGPDWERPRRYEAYPTIRTRVGLPAIPRIAVMVVALAIAAVALFFLPALLGLGGSNNSTAPSLSVSASPPPATLEPTAPPAPTPVVYTIKKGDTLSKIAVAHGLTLEELMAANPTIKDPNKISEGQQIIIPLPQDQSGGSAAPSGSAAP